MKKTRIKYFLLPGIILVGLSLAIILLIHGSEKDADQKAVTDEKSLTTQTRKKDSETSEKKPSPSQPEKQIKQTPAPPEPHEDEAIYNEDTAEINTEPDIDELKAEDEREIMRMREMLPGNMWIPGEPTQDETREHQNTLRDMVTLENKLRKDSATGEEKKTYYEYKIKMVDDRIAIIRYYQKRTKELEEDTGRNYLSEQDMAHGNNAITELEEKRQEYLRALSEAENEPDKSEDSDKPSKPDEPNEPDEPDKPNESEDNDA